MALFSNITRSVPSLLNSSSKLKNIALLTSQRNNFATSTLDSNKKESNQDDSKSGGWLDRVFSPSRIHTGNEPHSRLLSASEFIYEMHYHDAKPDCSESYIKKYEQFSQEVGSKTSNKAELVASFRVEIGNQDQFIHIWRYHDGYKQASNLHKLIRTDETLIKLNHEHLKDLRKRESQFMMSFSFWKHPTPQQHDSFYEMRSYVLKPGTMIEWANGWSKGITHRDNAVAGFFSQIGQLYQVHHIWRYADLQVRKDVRENAWRRPGWDECVSITVPNIVYLHSRWMSPNVFSPIR